MGVLKALEVIENLKQGDQKELEVFTAPFIKYNFQVSFNEDLNQEEVYLETIRALAKAQIIKLKKNLVKHQLCHSSFPCCISRVGIGESQGVKRGI